MNSTESAVSVPAATYTKMRNGAWGVRVAGVATVGQSIVISKRDGSSKAETVGVVLWTGIAQDGRQASLVTIAPTARSSAPYRNTVHYGGRNGGYTRRGQPCGYPGCTGKNFCDDCSE